MLHLEEAMKVRSLILVGLSVLICDLPSTYDLTYRWKKIVTALAENKMFSSALFGGSALL